MSGTQTTEGFKLNLDLLARIYLFKARARVLAYNLGFFNCGLSRFFFFFFFFFCRGCQKIIINTLTNIAIIKRYPITTSPNIPALEECGPFANQE